MQLYKTASCLTLGIIIVKCIYVYKKMKRKNKLLFHNAYFKQELCETLNSITAKEWVYDKKIVEFYDKENISSVSKTFVKNKVTCGLLYDEYNIFIGIIDTESLLNYVLTHSDIKSNLKNTVKSCTIVHGHITLKEVCNFLCSGLKHITVYNENDYQIISQRSIVKTLFEESICEEYIMDIVSKSVHGLQIGTWNNIETCEVHESARNVFTKMYTNKISSVPITNKGIVVGVISLTDILYACELLESIDKNVLDYLQQSRTHLNSNKELSCIVSCTKNCTLVELLRTMLYSQVHQIYILENQKVAGVITFLDVLKFFKKCID